jgi:hypothetical protein
MVSGKPPAEAERSACGDASRHRIAASSVTSSACDNASITLNNFWKSPCVTTISD